MERGDLKVNLSIPKIATQWQKGVVSLIIVALLLTLGYHGYTNYEPGFVYVVAINGQEVGTVRQQEELTKIIKHLTDLEREKTGYHVMIVEEISTSREFQFHPEIHLPNLQFNIQQLVSYEASGTLILVENEPVVIVENEAIASQVIEEVTEYYLGLVKGKIVNQPKILNELSFKNVAVDPEQIVDFESAKTLLMRGTTNYETYTVSRNDSLWDIANRANMTVDELRKANNLDSNVLRVGQQLMLTVAEPILEVEVVEEVSTFESIPFATQWRNNPRLWSWQTRVDTPGVNGRREVVYRVTSVNGQQTNRVQISSQIVSQPVTRIAERGTANLPNTAVGRFMWPLPKGVGTITSPFGNRRDPFSGRISFHSGVDVAAAGGTSVFAADSGTVAFAGWQGSYGNLVVIKHSGGYATFYAHLQSISVSTGSNVSKGQIIGRVGTTGNSTGNHLHFEVRTSHSSGVSGNPINPLNFYSP